MTTSSSHRQFLPEEPVESSVRRIQSSSLDDGPSLQVPGIIPSSPSIPGVLGVPGATSITAACRLPLLPLSFSQPGSGEISTTNGEIAVKAPRTSGESSPGSSLTLTVSKPVETIPSGSKPRRFFPQLVETTRRSRKSGDSGPTILLHDKTDVSPGTQEPPSQSLKSSARSALPRENSSVVSTVDVPTVEESRFSSSSLKKHKLRRHSFRIPELAPIQSTGNSEESNESDCSSASTTLFAASADNVSPREFTQHHKSGCEEAEGYLLALAAQIDSSRLREQAMAAYPNEKTHEPIDHFAVAREDGGPKSGLHARQHDRIFRELEDQQQPLILSATMVPQATEELCQDQVEAVEAVEALDGVPGSPIADPGARMRDAQMQKMRHAASPPLAGQELRFPLCHSPRQTRLDAGQLYEEKRQADFELKQCSGLWKPGGGASRKGSSTQGLWMGTSAKSAEDSRTGDGIAPTGLLTPAAEREEPMRSSWCECQPPNQLPPSPPGGSQEHCNLHCMNSVLSGEEEKMPEEFHDAFITQVYNYLSLGYPSMARKFDAELSKISKVPIEQLRQGDDHMHANGYLDAPERIGAGKEGPCARWAALKQYVKEWAKQQSHISGIIKEGINDDWGHREKKGSWAI